MDIGSKNRNHRMHNIKMSASIANRDIHDSYELYSTSNDVRRGTRHRLASYEIFFIDASDGMILLILFTCGTCGTFPTTAFATRRISQLSGRSTKLSPAGGLDCDTRNNHCQCRIH
jgi:hypothetical protein